MLKPFKVLQKPGAVERFRGQLYIEILQAELQYQPSQVGLLLQPQYLRPNRKNGGYGQRSRFLKAALKIQIAPVDPQLPVEQQVHFVVQQHFDQFFQRLTGCFLLGNEPGLIKMAAQKALCEDLQVRKVVVKRRFTLANIPRQALDFEGFGAIKRKSGIAIMQPFLL